ncbi:sporulation integral membrane protein YtvI [Virgibacillus halodenitrificans]|uniref:Sporulation integral membrane protein YtvI n=1 Tax=Virgibacillus halodenitrificans TaxID=1482 RepID=A0AAC9NL95_VIRHA|nr:sporulation integral membrane protein YtvI [Virgibacillus halodenitrificans]APC48745.1 sporulation integral membrane protein YtvI [Virgibacillus halodenitrificans]MBD1224603.1 sporulation integral membrane protein YtvI [Virgibacillus halodenitrificans]MCG1029765.1 sporulation integral membrane protein YtvI [Virgibacillus halodenitrificans]MYL46534.1 sporulation integral membrane protein YtvI [Virgibacillus halodenitrificans]WHX27051.1 sporulation integral membrane protein YtvI [Virgibacillu
MIRTLTKRHWTLIFIAVLLVLFIIFILPVSIPLIVAFFTALLLNPTIRLLQRKTKISRKAAVSIIFLLFLLLVGIAGTFIVTKAVTQVVNFVEDVPSHFNQLNDMYEEWEKDLQQYTNNLPPEFVKQISDSIEENLTALSNTAKEKITLDNIAEIFSKVPQYLISFIVYLIALFLFMLELPLLKAKMYNLLTKETAEKVSFMNRRLADVLLGFLKAQFLVSLLILAVSLVGLFLITPEVAIMMSLIIWIVDLIPIIGSIIILGPWALFLLLAGDTSLGIQLAVLAIILLAVRRIVEPKVMGQHIGLSPLATLIAMFIGLKLLGLLGFILGPLLFIAFNSAKEAGIIKWNTKI